ncbi:uncharacterized protein PFLUO_LOCUS4981 [Penicillium psychrofluorescens]|uniref:uncharacterized protein n=1 Tax=Penicillium psychrofluorescens TaxID=3158075 RepID=UPI003CCE45C9
MRRIPIAEGLASSWRCPPARVSARDLRCKHRVAHHPSGRTRDISSSTFPISNGPHLKTKRRAPYGQVSWQTLHTSQDLNDDIVAQSMSPPESKWAASEAEYAANFHRILTIGQPDQVMQAMTAQRSARLVAALPQPVYVAVLHLLSPSYFILPFRYLHHGTHEWAAELKSVPQMQSICDNFIKRITTIMQYRTLAGGRKNLAEYTHLLDCARATGDGDFAQRLWAAMKAKGIVPDGVAYSFYMEANVWNHCYTGAERVRLHPTERTFRMRQYNQPSARGYQGYRTAGYSIQRHMLHVFEEMKKAGHPVDERTAINLLIASARVGRLDTVRNVLNTFWNIDLNALNAPFVNENAEDNPPIPPVLNYSSSSALHPSENLLFAVAHALGTLRRIDLMMMVIEFISSSYNIAISQRVWREVFERAYVMASDAAKWGRIERDSMRSAFQTMTSDPYNVQPTLSMYRCMVNLNIRDAKVEPCFPLLQGAYAKYKDSVRKRAQALDTLLRHLNQALDLMAAGQPGPSPLESPQLSEALHMYDIARLEEWADEGLLQRCVFKVTGCGAPEMDIPMDVWIRQTVPKLMEEWRDFLPSQFYITGEDWRIDFCGNSTNQSAFKTAHHFVPQRRHTDRKRIFARETPPKLDDRYVWRRFFNKHQHLDTSIPLFQRILSFERIHESNEQREDRRAKQKAAEQRPEVYYPRGHPLHKRNAWKRGSYGRLVGLGRIPMPTDEIATWDRVPVTPGEG